MAFLRKNLSNHLMNCSDSFIRTFQPPLGDDDFRIHSYDSSRTVHRHFEARHPTKHTWLFCHFFDPVQIGTADGEVREYPGGSWIVWQPGQCRAYGHPSQSWSHSFLHLLGPRIARITAPGPQPGIPVSALPENSTNTFLSKLDAEATGELRPDPRIMGNLFENWILSLRRQIEPAGHGVPERLALVRQKLIDGTAAWHDLAQLAQLAGMSKSHLSARFREIFGESPGACQRRWRIERAKNLLRHPDLAIAEISEDLGFTDPFNFSRSFKNRTGMSPRAWRQPQFTKIKP